MSSAIERQLWTHMEFGKLICIEISHRMQALGISLAAPSFTSAEFNLITDPFTQQQNLIGYWFNPQRQKIGQVQFHSDGSCYAEYDVVQNHPSRPNLFIESIRVWGNIDNIKTEAKLLEMPQ